MAALHIICGLWSLVPCRGSDPEGTALTASDTVKSQPEQGLLGCPCADAGEACARGAVCRWSKDRIWEQGGLGQAVSRAVRRGGPKGVMQVTASVQAALAKTL